LKVVLLQSFFSYAFKEVAAIVLTELPVIAILEHQGFDAFPYGGSFNSPSPKACEGIQLTDPGFGRWRMKSEIQRGLKKS
jgi:hypothetical protein